MKTLLCIFLLCLGFAVNAQVVSGLYAVSLTNDSTQVIQRYEMALSEYKGKIYGYSYTTFIRNDSLFFSVKRLKGIRKDKQLLLEDDGMIYNNFPEPAAKRVKQINTINLTEEDTLRTANGTWKTTQTKIYYSLRGGAEIQRTNDSADLALINHLKELNIIGSGVAKTDIARADKKRNNARENAAASDTSLETSPVANVSPVTSGASNKTAISGESKPREKSATAHPTPAAKKAVLTYRERKNTLLQTIQVNADSVVLAFYDNGVIDGDSISIYVNNNAVLLNKRLTDRAVKQTVHFPKSLNEITVLLVAESLGTIPPNTGLLIIYEGENRHQLNFSADFQNNASLVLRRE